MKKRFISFSGFIVICIIAFYFMPTQPDIEKQEHILRYSTGTRDNPTAREFHEFNMLKNPSTGIIPAGIRLKELQFANRNVFKSSRLNKSNFSGWNFRGPINVGGRTRALAVDVTDDNIFLAGGVSSGMFRTTNQGDSWVKVTDDNALPNVTAIAQNQKSGHTNIWYYGTGEKLGNSASAAFSAEFLGNGIYKSIDNGISWNILPATYSTTPGVADHFDYCYRLVTNKFSNNEDEVLAALPGGIRRSTDGGGTWNLVLGSWEENMSIITDLSLAGNGKLYATLSTVGAGGTSNSAGIYVSSNGENWTNITPINFPTAHIRTIIAPSKSNPNKIYFLSNLPKVSDDDNNQLWMYDAGNNTWERKVNFQSGFLTQGEYCMALAVHPTNENILFVGGVGLYRSDNGYSSASGIHIGGYSNIEPYYVYPNHWVDQHVITFLNNSPSSMVTGHDAGVSLTTNCTADSVVWEYKPNGYITSQFYTVGISPNTSNSILLGGLQDRGSWGGEDVMEWDQMPYAGDGSYCSLTSNDSLFYISIQNGNIVRMFVNNGDLIITRIDPGNSPDFIVPFELDPNNENVMYLAKGDTLYRNSNLSAIPFIDNDEPTLINWDPITSFNQSIVSLSISTIPANIIYVGLIDGSVHKIEYDETGISTELISEPFWDGYPICIAINEEDANEIITVFSSYGIPSLYHSLNGGITWTDISGNLEENPDGSGSGPSCRWADIVTHGTDKMFLVGTSTGLYYTNSLQGQSTSWVEEDAVIKNSVVSMIKSRNSDGFVALVTHGKGAYSTNISTSINNGANKLLSYSLSQNYPNPFNPSTKIEFTLPHQGDVTIKVYDITGKEIKTLVNKNIKSGKHIIDFNAASMASGTYFYRITSDKFSETKKMILIK